MDRHCTMRKLYWQVSLTGKHWEKCIGTVGLPVGQGFDKVNIWVRYRSKKGDVRVHGTWPVRAKRYGSDTGAIPAGNGLQGRHGGKPVRGRYGQNCTGLGRENVQAKSGAGDVPLQARHICRCAARTGNIRGPLGCSSSLLWAVLGMSLPCPYRPGTGMFTGYTARRVESLIYVTERFGF